MTVTAIGATDTPAAGSDNLYATYGILGPHASVHYQATFTKAGQSVDAFVDATNGSGRAAEIMNLAQAGIDIVSLIVPAGFGTGFKVPAEFYPQLVDAFGAMPHLMAAGDALFGDNFSIGHFRQEFLAAIHAGEFNILGDAFERLGVIGAKEAFKTVSTLGIGEIVSKIDIIIRNFGNAAILAFRSPAGNVTFVSQ